VASFALIACGSTQHHKTSQLPPAAEPASAPAAAVAPAGRSVTVGNSPEGIAADPRSGLAVVSLRNPAQLVLLDLDTGRVVRRIPVQGPARHLQLARPGGPVLVPEEPVDTLLELSLPSGRSSSIAVGAHPHDATAAGPFVFVSDEFGRSVSVLKGPRVLATVGGFVQPGGIAAVGSDVAVVDVRADSVTLIDASARAVLGRLHAGEGPTHVVTGGRGEIYVLDTRGGAIFSYATRPALRLLARLSLPGGPYGVAIDPPRRRLWVTLTAKDELVELSIKGGKPTVLRTFPTGRQPNTLAVDPRTGTVWVANAGAGSVELIDPPAG
jgi:DNA-binding beta-propeller fold protein YncE